MTAAVLREARGYVSALIGPLSPGEKLKQRFPSVARALGFSERRVRAIWTENPKITGEELEHMRAVVARRAPARVVDDLLGYASRLESAAGALEMMDADFHRHEIDRLRNVACGIRNGCSAPAGVGVSQG